MPDITIVTPFRKDGVPQTGLTPILSGWSLPDRTLVLDEVTMTELGSSGVYKYIFEDARDLEYSFLADGGISITDDNERKKEFKKEKNEPVKPVKKPRKGESAPLENQWLYRKAITLSRASGAVTNFQLKLLVGESSGATGEDVDCGGFVKSDFSDLRFTNADDTLLHYWIEEITGTTPNQLATVWIEFDSIGTEATTFYMYYKNTAATAVSSGTATFPFFDGFDVANTSNLWPWTESHDVWSIDDLRLKLTHGGTNITETLVKGYVFAGQKMIEASVKIANAGGAQDIALGVSTNVTNNTHFLRITDDMDYSNGDGYNPLSFSVVSDTYYRLGIMVDITAGNAHYYIDNILKAENQAPWVRTAYSTQKVWFESYLANSVGYVNWVFVRQWLDVMPAWGSWGSRETGTFLL